METHTINLLEDFILTQVTAVENGNLNPLDLKIALKRLSELIEGVDSQIKPLVQQEARKWHLQDYNGYRIEYMESGGRYSYDHIPEIVTLKNELKEREKLHQLAYKNMNQGLFINEVTGEVYEPAVFKPSESYVKLIKSKK
jgi:hypothetical protein